MTDGPRDGASYLLHSLGELREIWLPLIERADVRSLTAVGGRLVAPEGLEYRSVRDTGGEELDSLTATDAYVIDGDHNYWTVTRDLTAIEQACAGREHFPLVLLTNVGWPCARRDHYVAPERLPSDAVHPYSYELGSVPGEAKLQPSGFRGEGRYAAALEEGGARNGVLTAVEDFLTERPELELHLVAPVFGLGVLFSKGAPWADVARTALAPYAGSALLDRLEHNRTQLYVRLIEQQDAFGAAAEQAARARRADLVRGDLEISAAMSRELVLRDQLGQLERELALVRSQLVTAQAAAQAATAAPPAPALWKRVVRRLLALARSSAQRS